VRHLLEYYDYREYLRDFYEEQKSLHDYFSFRYLGLKLNMDAGSLQRITQSKAHLAKEAIPRVTRFCKLSGPEADYFETLVAYNKAKVEKESKKLFDELQQMKDLRMEALSDLQFQYFSEWYHAPIRGMISLGGFFDDYQKLSQSLVPPISAEQARDSVQLLKRLGMICQVESGEWQIQDAILTTGKAWTSHAIRQFQSSMMDLAKESLINTPKEERDISTVTLTIPRKEIPLFRLRCEEFRKSIMKMAVESDESDSVYEINIQLFPVGVKNVD